MSGHPDFEEYSALFPGWFLRSEGGRNACSYRIRIGGPAVKKWGTHPGAMLLCAWLGVLVAGGCSQSGAATQPSRGEQTSTFMGDDASLRELATTIIKRGVQYPENPVVRAQGVEACEEALRQEALPVIRGALKDEQAGVRFAACMALGRLKDAEAAGALRGLLGDADASVRAAVYFALERLGDASHRKEWAELLRRHGDPTVRRNAALALGALGDSKAVALLDRAATSDPDEGVRLQAMEGMAVMGDKDAIDQLLRFSIAGRSFRQPFALLALGRVKDDRVAEALRSRLESAPYLESKLAAARSLGAQGRGEGFDLALGSLEWNQPQADLPDDPPVNQVMRVRSMAALALGEIGDRRALKALAKRMQTPDDPRVQLAAATAILMILNGPAR